MKPFSIGQRTTLWQLLLILICSFGSAQILATAQTPPQHYQAYFKSSALPLDRPTDLAPLYRAIGDRRFVLLGESTHGTHEYYRWRATISRHLIEHKGFNFVAVEGDWPTIYRLNDYVKLRTPDDLDARNLMRTHLTRWPQWMWANEEFAEFVEWLRAHNAKLPNAERVGIFGLDMQDPQAAMSEVLGWFKHNDPDNYPQVEAAYQRILDFPDDFRGYARHLMRGGVRLDSQMAIAVSLLQDHLGENPAEADKSTWAAKQNALAVKRAEAQFHGATQRGPDSWNARARFMHETLLRLTERHGDNSRGIVWAHNTHVGDSAATDMRNRGEVNIGHLARASAGEDQVFILGFGTYQGTVIAGQSWGGARQTMTVVPARPESYEGLLHSSGLKKHLLLFGKEARQGNLMTPLQQRAIGVIYQPPNEAYVSTILTQRYDGFIFFERTKALRPLKR